MNHRGVKPLITEFEAEPSLRRLPRLLSRPRQAADPPVPATQPASQGDLRAAVLSHLRERRSLTLATFGPEGPWAAGVYFAADGLSLYFLSDPASRHCRDLAANPRVAATVHEDVASWQDIRGVQLSGCADAVSPAAEAAGPGTRT